MPIFFDVMGENGADAFRIEGALLTIIALKVSISWGVPR
jgi:hypothetical protein